MKSFLFFVLLACIFFAGCSSSKKRSQNIDSAATDSTQAANESQADSMDASDTVRPTARVAPAPGTVRVKAEILDIINSDVAGSICRLKIVAVEAYGSNTPPLGEGAEIEAAVPKDFLETSTDDNATHTALKSGVVADLLLRYQQVPNLSGKKLPNWQINSVR